MSFFSGKLNFALAGTLLPTAAFAATAAAEVSPDYAAMFAVPAAVFHSDIRGVLSHLDFHRYEKFLAERNWEIYANFQYYDAENGAGSKSPTFDYDFSGAVVGADCRLSRTSLFGLALAAGTGDADIRGNGGKIEVADYRLTIYASKILAENLAFDLGANFGYGDYEIKRETADGNVGADDTDGWNIGIFANLSTRITISKEYKIFAEPFIGTTFFYSKISDFEENGSGALFDVDEFDGSSFTASIGCTFAWEFELAGTRSRLGLSLAYTHDFTGDETDIDANLLSDQKEKKTIYSVSAAALPEDCFSVGPTLDVGLTDFLGVFANYSFEVGTGTFRAHSANVGLRARF